MKVIKMKSLNKYVSESLYSNLGIDDAIDNEALNDWLKRYQDSLDNQIVLKSVGDKLKIEYDPFAMGCGFIINTDPKFNLAPGGELPDYCKDIEFTKPVYSIGIISDPSNPLKSFGNIPDIFVTDIFVKPKFAPTIYIKEGIINDLDFNNSSVSSVSLDIDLRKVTVHGQIKNIKKLCNLTVRYNNLESVINLFNSFYKVNTNSFSRLELAQKNAAVAVKVRGDLLNDYVAAIQKNRLYIRNADIARKYDKICAKMGWSIKPKGVLNLCDFTTCDIKFLKNINPTKINVINIMYSLSTYPVDDLRLLPKGVLLSLDRYHSTCYIDQDFFESLPKDEFAVYSAPDNIYITKL